jgi:glycosyltransferase 2 family protein
LKQWLIPIFKLGVAAALIFWLIQSERFDMAALSKLNAVSVWLTGLVVFLMVFLINSKRWQILLRFEQVNISYTESVRLSLIGLFFNFFVPGGVGGDVVKGSYLIRHHKSQAWFIGWSILVDRVFGVLALLLYSALTGVFYYDRLPANLRWSFYSLSLLILMGLVSLVVILIFLPKKKLARLLESQAWAEKTLLPLFYFVRVPRRGLWPFLLSLVSQGMIIGLGAYLVYHLGLDIPLWVMLLIFPFGFLATVVPIAPAGIGVGQAAFFYLFDRVVGQGEFGVLTITYLQAIQFLIGLLGGVLFITSKKAPKESGLAQR